MKKALIGLSMILTASLSFAQDNTTRHEYPTFSIGMFIYQCTMNIGQNQILRQQIGPIENGIWICSCSVDRLRKIYTFEEVSNAENNPFLKEESERIGRECFLEFRDKFLKPAPTESF